MKAAKFSTRIDDRNRLTIPHNNVNILCKDLGLTEQQFQEAEFGLEIKYIIPRHRNLIDLN